MIQQFQSISTGLGALSAEKEAEAEATALSPHGPLAWFLNSNWALHHKPRYPLSKYLLQIEVGTEAKIPLKNNHS